MAETGQTAAWQLSDGEPAAAICASEKEMRAAYARHLDLVTEAGRRGLGPVSGYRDTTAFLVGTLHISRNDARARVAIATTELPSVRAALAAGEIGPQQAAEIAKVLRQAPPAAGAAQVAAQEETLAEPARQAIPSTVRKAGQRILGYWDLDSTEPQDRGEELARPRREFRYTWTRDGRMKFSGEFEAGTGRLAEELFVPLATPDPADEHGNPDPRTTAQRQGDAVAAIFDLAARADGLPVRAGERAVATVTIPYTDLLRASGLVTLDGGETLTVSQLRRLLCDAKIYPAVLGGEGQVLDLGRAARTATPAQRRALAIRDRGCTGRAAPEAPNGTTPHHVTFWAAHGGWDSELHHGVVYWIPPEWLDPRRKPLRNTVHDPPQHQAA